MKFHATKTKDKLFIIFKYFTSIVCYYLTEGQQLPAYITENSPGCINTSVTSWNIPEDFVVHLKKETIVICTLAGIPGGDPFIGINLDYRDRISCGIDVNQKQTFICFINAVNISDAGVYSAELTVSSTVFNNTLYVMRPPTKPVISLQGDLINQRSHNLTCSAVSTSVPVTGLLMTYSWTDDGAAITDPRFTLSGQGNNVLMINRVRKEDKGKTIQCRATEDKGISSVTSDQTILDVLYTPEVSTSTPSPYKVVEGQTATLACSVTAANPNTDIRWSWIKTDSPSSVLHTGPNYTISNIQRNQSGNYNCRATNSIGMSIPATIHVDVQYKPEVSTLTSSPYRVVEGQTATLTCSVTAANPNTDIRWSWIKTDSPSSVLNTGPNYTISNIQRNQSGNYNCRATNSIGMSSPATIQVDVQYGPASVIFSPDIIIINKTENQTVTPVYCSAVCNPNCTYLWTGVTTVKSGVLDVKVLKRTMRGDYTCTASNTIRSTSRTISVYINYPPTTEVFQASGNKIYEESSPFNITCEVDSYPFSDINILNIDTGEVKASGGPLESLTYSESSAKCYHAASYTCNSKNSYGSTSSAVQRIFIFCRPRPFDGQSNINTGIKTNEGLNISATFIAYPPPVLSWKFRKSLTDVNKTLSSEFQISSVTLNVSTVQTVLTKETLNQEEFGYYTCSHSD
ncbi:LOW QUALITY PROTEIN: B-cell receptor CD22-like [Saccostrea cucullata]|uniref:LOW QUALITY PROTEIN: B-cell receptor CD22-like n=1 Tax=Saccostrea cuccullata TaxID=36930 RepID=UPI002ED22AEF